MPTIISPKGNNWTKQITLNNNIKPYFLKYTDKQLIHLMRNSGFAEKSTKMFDEPDQYTMYLYNFFVGNKAKHKTYSSYEFHLPNYMPYSKPILYCIDCVRESLIKNGFGYFRAEWFNRGPNYCDVHKKSLYTLTETSRKEGMENLSLILKGHNPKKAKMSTQLPYNYHEPYVAKKYTTSSIIQLSSCLHYQIKLWFCSNTHSFPQSVTDLIGLKYSPSMKIDNNNARILQKIYLEKVIKALLQTRYEPFMAFWNKNAVKRIIYCGIINKYGLHERIYVYKGIDCQICPVDSRHFCIKNKWNKPPYYIS